MVCPACGLGNDPSSTECARCNTTLNHPSGARPVSPATVYRSGPPRRNHRPLIAGVVVLVAVVALFLAVRDPDDGGDDATRFVPGDQVATTATAESEPEPVPPAATTTTETGGSQAQAVALDEVLAASVTSKSKLNSAIQRITSCTDVDSAVTDMRDVGAERESQIQLVQQADLSALPGGEDLRSGLVAALTYSLEADQAYLGWAEPAATAGCADTSSRSQAYARGTDISAQARAAKSRFLERWNPVATDNGLSTRTAI